MAVAGISLGTTVTSQVAVLLPALAVIVAVPKPFAVTVPLATVATVSSDELHSTASVLLSGVTVAVSVAVSPFWRLSVVLESVIAVAGISFGTTVTSQVAVLLPALAVIVAVPMPFAVTTPLAIVATDSSDELHSTASVLFSGVTVAVSVAVLPFWRLSVVSERVMAVAGISLGTTVTSQVAVLLPALAVMVAVPTSFAVTVPFATVATDSSDELHSTASVLFSGVTVAVSVTVLSFWRLSVVLESFIAVAGISFGTTVISQVAVLLPALAVIVAVPMPFAVTVPFATVATVSSDELHLTASVLFSGVTVAVSVAVSPFWRLSVVLESVISVAGTSFGTTVTSQVTLLSPMIAVMVAVPMPIAVTVPFSTAATDSSEDVQTGELRLMGTTVSDSDSESPN